MLGSLLPSSMPYGAFNVWSAWLAHAMKPARPYALKKAAIIHDNGEIAAATHDFSLHPLEVKLLVTQFDKLAEMPEKKPAMIVINDKTYLVKQADDRQIVAWNGKKYFIVCRSNSLLLVVLCQSKNKVDTTAAWLKRVNQHLMDAQF